MYASIASSIRFERNKTQNKSKTSTQIEEKPQGSISSDSSVGCIPANSLSPHSEPQLDDKEQSFMLGKDSELNNISNE